MGMENTNPKKLSETPTKLIRRFLADENTDVPPPPTEIDTHGLRAAAKGAVLAGGMLASAPHDVAAQSAAARVERQAVSLNDLAFDFLAQNVYHEARGESVKGQLAVAQVTLARYLSGKFGKTLTTVVFKRNQYSWTDDPKILMARIDDEKLANIKAMLSLYTGGKQLRDSLALLAQETGIPANAYYYKRSDWDEKNEDEKRMSKKTKEMFKSLTPVGSIGSHTFYTD